jgi:hypothetical protein
MTERSKPELRAQSFDIVLTPLNATDQEVPPEDPAPSASKVRRDDATGDFVVADVSGLRLSVRWRLDNRGYDVASSESALIACSVCDMPRRHAPRRLVAFSTDSLQLDRTG